MRSEHILKRQPQCNSNPLNCEEIAKQLISKNSHWKKKTKFDVELSKLWRPFEIPALTGK